MVPRRSCSLNYHRWNSPINGTVTYAEVIDGTYYAARLDDDPSPNVISRSDDFVANLATRAIIIIRADNKKLGLVGFIGVGLGEVSTCQIADLQDKHVNKGDELGMFRFGGSTHCLIFGPQVEINQFVDTDDLVKLNTPILGITN